jgi:hypothetical protein
MSGFLGMFAYGGATPTTPSEYVAYTGGSLASQQTGVYPWSSASGFGTIYSTPAALRSNLIQQISFVKDNSLVSTTLSTSPYLYAFPWSASGFGTQYSNPSSAMSPTGTPAGFTWTNAIDAVITANQPSVSYPQAWAWSAGFGTKYSNGSAINASGSAYGVSLNSDNTLVAFNFNTSPYVALYPWSSASGFGTRYSNPATTYTGAAIRQTISFNATTNDLALGSATNPYVSAYAVSSSGFGSKYSNPPADGFVKNSLRFSPDGAYLATATTAGTALFVYSWSSGFGSVIYSPVTSSAVTVDWSSTGTEIGKNGNPINVWPWSAGFGTQYTNSAPILSPPQCVSFSNQSR